MVLCMAIIGQIYLVVILTENVGIQIKLFIPKSIIQEDFLVILTDKIQFY